MAIPEFLKFHHAAKPQAAVGDTETVRKIVAALDRMDPEHARYVAAFAFILCRVARADMHISPSETQVMERVLVDRAGLPQEQAILVVQMAKTQSTLFGGTEDFVVTREFNRLATRDQKLALLDCLFAVASDEMISTAEENEISQICSELQLEREDMVEMRAKYRDYRAVLKPATPPSQQ